MSGAKRQFAFPSRLYAIVDPPGEGDALRLAGVLLAGGARLLQLRLKDRPTRDVFEAASAIAPLAHRHRAIFLVNDRPDVARAAPARGVHLGQDDLPPAAARRVLGPRSLIGLSTHGLVQAQAAAAEGVVDYIAVGPIFPTTTKKSSAARALGLAGLRAIRAAVALPIVAIGGITEASAPEVLAAGADAVAMIGALTRAPDPAAAVARLVARIDRGRCG